MMATGYPQHPGNLQNLQHPGMPHAQQMGPSPNPGQHLGQAMQMHPGVSGPNGPHVSQAGAMIPGMQQGVGPNAHALSHLTPQPHMFQPQQQQMQAMNPALVQQQQNQAQHAALFQQRQRQLAFQQQQQNGMGMGFPGGMNPSMSAQVAAMQGNPQGNFPIDRVNLPPHMQQQLLQQRQMQQQQAQAQQAAQQQAQQQAAHQQQQMTQHLAMQHAASQSSNPGQQGPQGPQTSQPQQGPLRPPSQMSAEGHVSPAPPPNPQQSQPPQAQPPQAPNQPQNLQQQPSQQQHPQTPQQMQQRPQQALNPSQVAMQQAMLRRQQEQARQQQGQGGQTILRLLSFLDHLSRFATTRQANDIVHWDDFVRRFFSPDGEFKHTLFDRSGSKTKQFPVSFAALPRYFYVQFDSGVENIQITIDGAIEKNFGTDCNYVESGRAKIIYSFQNGTQLVCHGKLSAIYSQSNQQSEPKLDLLSFETQGHQEFIPRKTLERLFTQPSPSQLSQTQSPRMTNKPNAKQRNQQRQLPKPDVPPEPFLNYSDLPQAPIDDYGVTAKTLQYLEIGETFSHMNQLIHYAQDHPELTPAQALNNLLQSLPKQFTQQPNQQQQGNMPPNQAQLLQQQQQQNLPPGSRTPSGTGQPGGPTHQFMSPAMANLGLPGAINGSPHLMHPNHTPSPAQTHGLVNQHSQQGTNSSATASANTSPNVSNKRRRSNVKMETDDGGGGEVNGTGGGGGSKVKASPRVSGNKRVKNG